MCVWRGRKARAPSPGPGADVMTRSHGQRSESCLALEVEEAEVQMGQAAHHLGSVAMAETLDKKGSQESMELFFVNINLTDFPFFIQIFGIVHIQPDVLTYLF